MSDDRIAGVKSHHSSFGRIELQNSSGIDGEVSPPLEYEICEVATLRTRRRKEAGFVHGQKTGTHFSKDPEFFKTLPNLHPELALNCPAVGGKNRRLLWEKVDLSICRYGPVEVECKPAADSSLSLVEPEVRTNQGQRGRLTSDFDFVFRALCNRNGCTDDDSEKE